MKYKGPKLWNELPTQLKSYISTEIFTKNVNIYLRSQQT